MKKISHFTYYPVADTIRSISTNYQLGFGTFVDKPLAPYVDTRP